MFRKSIGALVPLFAAVVAFFFGVVMLLALGASPIEGFSAMLDGVFGSGERLAATAVRAAPLLLVGAGICIAFRARVTNIGGESQIISGALLSTVVALNAPDLPAVLLIPLVVIAGAAGGLVAGAIPGALKAYAGVNEILSTIMMNLIMVQFMNYLLRGPPIDPFEVEAGTRIPQTERPSDNAALPTLIDGTRLHLGVPIAVVAAVLAYVLLWRTPLGFRLRAVGHNADAARAAGIDVKRNITYALAISGSFCGIAGVVLVFGSEGQRMVTDGSTAGFTGGAGFSGIVAALFSYRKISTRSSDLPTGSRSCSRARRWEASTPLARDENRSAYSWPEWSTSNPTPFELTRHCSSQNSTCSHSFRSVHLSVSHRSIESGPRRSTPTSPQH